jgi:hypothetical protein
LMYFFVFEINVFQNLIQKLVQNMSAYYRIIVILETS